MLNSNAVNQDKQIFTPEQVSEMLDLKNSYVKRLLRDGELKGFKINKFWRIRKDSLDAFIDDMNRKDQGKAGLSKDTINRIKFHASLKSKATTPYSIEKLTENITRLKAEIQTQDRFGRIPKIDKLKTNVTEREEKRQKLEDLPDLLDALSDQAYPGVKELVDEDPDSLETMFAGKSEKPKTEKRRKLKKLPGPLDASSGEAYPAEKEMAEENPDVPETMFAEMEKGHEDANFSENAKAAEKPWRAMKAGDES